MNHSRRTFLKRAGLSLSAWALADPWLSHMACLAPSEVHADVVIIGGGVGGCAAALAAARSGLRVVMTEETDWIGGQLTQQGVPPDEHAWIEQFGATQSYRVFRRAVRAFYREAYPLTDAARMQWNLNPGSCGVSRICHEPRVALAVLERMLAPHLSTGRLTLLLNTHPVAASVSGDRVEAVRVRHGLRGDETDLTASYFLDATEDGALLPLTGTEYVTGAEAQAQAGELHAPAVAQPANMQAATWCFAVDYRDGEDHTIDRPRDYAFWRDHVPPLTPAWPGTLLNWTYAHPITLEPRTPAFDPRPGAVTDGFNLWTYRRLIDPANFASGAYAGGISLINWPQNDYMLGNLFDVGEDEAARHREQAMQLSLSLLYWMQTEAPRADGGAGWPGLRLRGDVMGTVHGLAKRPYIRESRRIKAVFTVLEQHVGLEARQQATGLPPESLRAVSFPDAVGLGSYRIDLHPSTGGDNYIDVASLPFEIPLGALLPERVVNLLPACKNLGVTHITNGCYRLHPVEWNVGEAAGALAAFCVRHGHAPRAVRDSEAVLADFQRQLQRHGIAYRWPVSIY